MAASRLRSILLRMARPREGAAPEAQGRSREDLQPTGLCGQVHIRTATIKKDSPNQDARQRRETDCLLKVIDPMNKMRPSGEIKTICPVKLMGPSPTPPPAGNSNRDMYLANREKSGISFRGERPGQSRVLRDDLDTVVSPSRRKENNENIYRCIRDRRRNKKGTG
jgi:hypothetical protein